MNTFQDNNLFLWMKYKIKIYCNLYLFSILLSQSKTKIKCHINHNHHNGCSKMFVYIFKCNIMLHFTLLQTITIILCEVVGISLVPTQNKKNRKRV